VINVCGAQQLIRFRCLISRLSNGEIITSSDSANQEWTFGYLQCSESRRLIALNLTDSLPSDRPDCLVLDDIRPQPHPAVLTINSSGEYKSYIFDLDSCYRHPGPLQIAIAAIVPQGSPGTTPSPVLPTQQSKTGFGNIVRHQKVCEFLWRKIQRC